ncbi:MAG: nitroreductase family protein [Firmicutes bacterium]|nr:nitroreductase family protein [Bacillota bacterium]
MINEFLELCKRRQSIRKFTAEPVPDDALKKILEAAQTAPSAGNLQAYEIVVVKEPHTKQKLAAAALGQGFVAEAPVVLVFLALPAVSAKVYGERGAGLYSIQDATIACTYAMLAAASLNLAATWVGAFRDREVRDAVGAGGSHVPVALLPLGRAGETPRRTARRPLQNMIRMI